MLTDRDPGVRRVAAWALAHTEDMEVAPLLIDALVDPEEEVVAAARLGLQVLSRKIEGLGPPSPSTSEQRRAAAQRWRDWFHAIRPLDLDEPDTPSTARPGGARSTAAGAATRSSTP
jgi:HEAT repeat protein